MSGYFLRESLEHLHSSLLALLGAKGIATRSKEATNCWPFGLGESQTQKSFATSFLSLEVRPGATSSVLAPSRNALCY